MKKIRVILSIILSVIMVLQFNIVAFAKTTTTSKFTGKTYTHNDYYDSYQKINVIDVSHHNGNIDFEKVKKAGVEGVFIRVGYTGYTRDKHSLNYDKMYKTYIPNALKAGLKVGVYWYSQALNTTEAKAEADKVLAVIKEYDITMPVVFDYEFASVSDGRLDYAWAHKTINATKMTQTANAFLQRVESAGYIPCIYASEYFFYDNLVLNELYENAELWLAHYITKTDYKYTSNHPYKYWQYSANGKVDGIDSTYTDCNFLYLLKGEEIGKSFDVEEISNRTYTGSSIKPIPKVYFEGEELVAGADFMMEYRDNKNIGFATAIVKGINDYENMPSKATGFKIVPNKLESFAVDRITINSADVSWSPSTQASNYIVQVYRKDGWRDSGTTTDRKFTIKGLNSASNYSFRVACYKTISGVKYISNYIYLKATTLPKKQSLSYTANSSSITLKVKAEKYGSGYMIYKYDSEAKAYKLYKKTTDPSVTSFKVDSLKADTKYKFKARSYKINKEGKTIYGSYSDVLTAYTTLATPKLKTLTCTGSYKMKPTWTKVSGATGYQYRWSTTSNLTSDYVNKTTTSTSPTINTSKNKRYYYVKVRAYKTRDGVNYYTPWSNTLKVYVK